MTAPLPRLSIRGAMLFTLSVVAVAVLVSCLLDYRFTRAAVRDAERLTTTLTQLQDGSGELQHILADIQRIAAISILLQDDHALLTAASRAREFHGVLDAMEELVWQPELKRHLAELRTGFRTFLVRVLGTSAQFVEGTEKGRAKVEEVAQLARQFSVEVGRVAEALEDISDASMQQMHARAKGGLHTRLTLLLPVLAAIVFGVVFLERTLARPMTAILASVRSDELTSGSPPRKMAVTWGGELGELGHSVNAMFDTLARSTVSRDQLEERVSARTVELRAANERLAAEISQRKALEDTLRHTQKMEAVGTLASGVAHDFNNILQAISGNVELAAMNHPDGTADAEGARILECVERGTELVRRILLFSRIDQAELEPLDLNGKVIAALTLLQRTLPKTVEIRSQLAPDLPPVNGASGQIEQVILNLGTNSRDAMPEGGQITVTTCKRRLEAAALARFPEAAPGDYVVLSFADSGVGMDPETLERMFEPFYTTKAVGEGTGLGLAMVYGIVHSHGGFLECNSEPGVGTTFTVYLPALAERRARRSAGAAATGPVAGGSETILIVDDEEGVRRSTAEILGAYGYRTHTAASGEEALEVVQQSAEVELVVLDLGMPGMGGAACLRQLRQSHPNLPVVVASGYYASQDQAGEALQDADVDFVPKPYRMGLLAATVREILDRSGVG